MKKLNVLIATEDIEAKETLKKALSQQFSLHIVETLSKAKSILRKSQFQFGFLDIHLLKSNKTTDIPEALNKIWNLDPNLEIFTLTRPTDQATLDAVQTIHEGAFRYLTLPLVESEINLLLDSFAEQRQLHDEISYLREQITGSGFYTKQSSSPKMKAIYKQIQKVATTNSNIYISGETGTGKSLIAKLIHQNSLRKKHPFISVHCGAIPEPLLESELFGHEKGAFTGAEQMKLGKFELANKGTLFLDEIGTMPLIAQIKLLQIIQERINIRVGGSKEYPVDVRIISASNENLQQLCDEGKFRKDLYYRLNVFPISLPLLRDRKEDIPLLVNTFVKKLNLQHQSQIKGVHPKAMALLMKYHWPGNIRELENVLERSFILETSNILYPSSFPREFEIVDQIDNKMELASPKITLKEIRSIEVNRVEKTYLKNLLSEYQGKISDTASAAGITTRQLHKLLAKHDIKKETYKRKNIKDGDS